MKESVLSVFEMPTCATSVNSELQFAARFCERLLRLQSIFGDLEEILQILPGHA